LLLANIKRFGVLISEFITFFAQPSGRNDISKYYNSERRARHSFIVKD